VLVCIRRPKRPSSSCGQERKIGTELFVQVATVIAFLGEEYVAAAVLTKIILIGEDIADPTDRVRRVH
jgi:Zn2+/Cd2+-exporting ATPase